MSDTFAADLRKFAEKAGKSLDATCRGVAIKWFSSTVMSTPVDTGRLRGNWQLTRDQPAGGISARLDPLGVGVVSDITLHVGGVGTVNYLTNNLPYAEAIEYGHSKQAPSGMVRINFARIKGIVADVARRNQA